MRKKLIKKLVRKNKLKKLTRKFGAKLELTNIDWDKVEKIFIQSRDQIKRSLVKDKDRNPHVGEILTLLAGGAIIAMSFVVPTLPMALAPFIMGKKGYKQGLFDQTIYRLKKQKLVEIFEENGQTLVKITQEGKVRALKYKLSDIQVKKPKSWDKLWRIVIFDIPEKYKYVREMFRDHLKGMGFYMLQKSVWVYPYPCFDEIEFLRQIYKVEINVTYILAKSIENSEYLADNFQLNG